jgi:hypothetical protein
MRNFQTKLETYILCSILVFRKSCRLRNNFEKCGTARQATGDNIIWRIRIACWVTKAADTHTHSEYVKNIVFSPQNWLRGHASICRYTYTACLVNVVPQHGSCRGKFVIWNQHPLATWNPSSPEAYCTLFHRKVSKCSPRASKQFQHLKKMFLDTIRNYLIQILTIYLRKSFNSCKEYRNKR